MRGHTHLNSSNYRNTLEKLKHPTTLCLFPVVFARDATSIYISESWDVNRHTA